MSKEKHSEKSSHQHVLCSWTAMIQTKRRLECFRMCGGSHRGRGRNEMPRIASPHRGGPNCGALGQFLCNKFPPCVWVSVLFCLLVSNSTSTNVPFSCCMTVCLSSLSAQLFTFRFIHEIGIQHFSYHVIVQTRACRSVFHIILFFSANVTTCLRISSLLLETASKLRLSEFLPKPIEVEQDELAISC